MGSNLEQRRFPGIKEIKDGYNPKEKKKEILMVSTKRHFFSIRIFVFYSFKDLFYARPPCPSPTPRVYSNSCPLSQWCHPTISCFAVPFSSCLQSFPASWSFQMSQLLHEVAKVLEFQLHHQSFQWTPRTISFRMDWLDLLAVQGTLKSLQHHNSKASIFWHSAFFTSNSHIHTWPLEKP